MKRFSDLFAWYGSLSKYRDWLLCLGFFLKVPSLFAVQEINVDVCVYGGTSGGVIAAAQAAEMGKTVALVSPTTHLGGLTTSGLGWTDLGNASILGGLSREFYHRIYRYYQNPSAWVWQTEASFGNSGQGGPAFNDATQLASVFEPSVAEATLNQFLTEHSVPVYHGRLDLTHGTVMQGQRLIALRTEDGTLFRAKMFIDASYEGDLMAKAGVTYTVGREANATYNEVRNGIQAAAALKNQLPDNIDPYVVAGNPASGLLSGVNATSGGVDGSVDDKLQAYCYRMVLTDVTNNRVLVAQPAGYNAADYELLFRSIAAGQTSGFFKLDMMPNRKTDSNNSGGLSTDFIGGNYGPDWNWAETDHNQREQAALAHRNWQLGLLWTLQNHPLVPLSIRTAYAKWGLPADEFTDNGHWPYQIYVREARRMISDYVMTRANCTGATVATDSAGLAAYTMDSHNVQRHVKNGFVKNEGDVQDATAAPYPVSYRSIVPRTGECENILVPWCLSASHMAFGSIRMEAVFMILSQSAATAACFAIDDNVTVQNIHVTRLQAQLLADGQVLTPGGGMSTGVNNTPSLLLDFGPASVLSLTDKLNSPAHGIAGLSTAQTNWNTGIVADAPGGLIYSSGVSATGISLTLGRSTAGSGIISFTDKGFTTNSALGAQINSGIYLGNSPIKDGIFGGSGGTSALAMGLRVNGLTAGVYSVYVTARNTSTQSACPEQIYCTNGSSATTYAFTSSPSVQQTNASPANTAGFVLGDNCRLAVVTLSAGQALYLAAVGAAANELRGFLNSVEIVPGLPQTNLPIIQLWATDANASRSGPTTGTFTISRSANTNVAVTVNLNFGGTATNGVDYLTLDSSVAIPAGVISTNIKVLPFISMVPVGDKIATISLASDATYTVGNLSSATIVIKDTSIHDWQSQYFGGNANNAFIAGDNAAPAGDGIPNLVKYALGLNPTSNIAAASMQPQIVNSYFTFSYTRPDPAPDDITYEIQVSNNLVTWSNNASTIQQIVYNTDKTAAITSRLSLPVNQASNQFVRLQVARKNSSKSIQGATVVAFGDSITFGYGLSGSQTWTGQLASRFNLNLINAGVSGNTSSQGLARMETDVLARQPDFVIINFGMNDHVMNSLDSPKVSQATFQTNLITMIDRVRSVGAIPVLVTVNYIIEGDASQYYYNRHPASYYNNVGGAQAWLDGYVQIVRNVAAAKGADLVDIRAACDSYNRFDFLRSLTNGAATDDGVHPYIIGANIYGQMIGDLLAEKH